MRRIFQAVVLSTVLAAKGSSGGSSKCPDAKLWTGSGVVPLCKAHFPEAGAKNGWLILFTGEDMWQQRLIQEVRTTFVAASKEHQRSGEPKNLKFGGVSCYAPHEQEFCKARGVHKFPTVYYTDGSRLEPFPKAHADLRTVAAEELVAFAAKQQEELHGVERHGGSCQQGIFAKDSEDYVVPLCDSHFPAANPQGTVPWIVALYDKGSKHEDKALRVALNKLAKGFGHSTRAKKTTKKVSAQVGAVLCAKSPELCEGVEGTTIRLYAGGKAISTFESFVDIDEIKSWATAQLAVAAEHVKQQVAEAEAEVEASADPAALQEDLAKLQAEKAAAVAAENFAEAKRLKALIASKESQLAQVKVEDPAELEAEIAKAKEAKAAAVAAENFAEAKRLKSELAKLEKRLAKAKGEL